MQIDSVQYAVGLAGTVAFAATAVAAVAPNRIDLFGALVMGVITAIGGGTVRDLILDVPVFWASDLNYIWIALAASFATFYGSRVLTRGQIYRAMLYLDALGVALFSIAASQKTMDLDFGWPIGPVILGITTAIGGGLIRDVLAGRTTLLMRREIYAVPVMLGCTLFVALMAYFPQADLAVAMLCILLIFGFRSAAIYWDLAVPDWLAIRPTKGDG